MNKLLVGTAAIALFASPALAAPIGVTVGGYYNSMFYNVDSDSAVGRLQKQQPARRRRNYL